MFQAGQSLQNLLNFCGCENFRSSSALSALTDQADRVTIEKVISAGVIEQQAHQVAQLRAG